FELTIQNPGRRAGVGLRELRPWLTRLVSHLAPEARSLGILLAGDAEVRRLNRRHRGIDRPTDVLSFRGGPTPEGRHLGDIVISVPTARRQAAERGDPLWREIRCLLLHGILHCMGHDHESDDGIMERLEERLRREWIGEGG
ncbi:MAG: rRNA maturation RNase YbeY, partial [Thermoanaerobaculia bacterium]